MSQFHIVSSAVGGGSIDPDGDNLNDAASTVIFTMVPSAGFHLRELLLDGVNVGISLSYSLTNIQAAHTLVATFVTTTGTTSYDKMNAGSLEQLNLLGDHRVRYRPHAAGDNTMPEPVVRSLPGRRPRYSEPS